MCLLPMLQQWKVKKVNIIVRSITAISMWSYSLYLIHVPVHEVVKILATKMPIIYQEPYNYLMFIIWIGVSIFLSYLIYTFFEKPAMNMRDWDRETFKRWCISWFNKKGYEGRKL